jgi:hypothetical protein
LNDREPLRRIDNVGVCMGASMIAVSELSRTPRAWSPSFLNI